MKDRNQKQQPQPKQKPAQKSSKAAGLKAQVTPSAEVRVLPLNKLHPSPLNVRKTGGQKVEDLAASIAAEGLIHNLTVIDASKGKSVRFEVIAGGRRLKALQLLVKQGVYKADTPIECRIVAAEQATGVSLAENVIREAMHPADQFDAFRQLVDAKKSETEIAARFGVTTAVVRERLAMARVAPEVIEAYRADTLTLDQVMSFTVTSDHDAHRAILGQRYVPSAWEIKRQLTAGAVTGQDRRAVFVGQKAYTAAGGKVRKDLFAQRSEDATYYEDGALLEQLAVAKLDAEADTLREAWAWVEVRTELDYSERGRFGQAPTVRLAPTAEQAEQLAQLETARVATRAALATFEQQPEREDDDADEAQWQALDEAAEAAEDALNAAQAELEIPDPNAADYAGAIITLGHGGKVEIHTGLVRPEDKAKVNAAAKQAGNSTAPTVDTGPSDPLPVRMGLSALRTAVTQDALAENINVALRALAFSLAQTTLRMSYHASCHGVHVRGSDKATLADVCEGLDDTPVGKRNTERAEAWEATLPEDDAALWAWCLAADDHTIASLLAYCTARTLDGVQRFPNSTDQLGPVAEALGIDMADHWQPTPAYFAKVKKADTLAALAGDDGKAPADLAKLKRDQLAEEAAKRLAGTRWLPPTLRAAV